MYVGYVRVCAEAHKIIIVAGKHIITQAKGASVVIIFLVTLDHYAGKVQPVYYNAVLRDI